MKTTKRVSVLLTLFFLFLFSIFIVSAQDIKSVGISHTTDYTITDKGQFVQSNFEDYTQYIKSVDNNEKQPPLIIDYDNDSIKEIIVNSGNNIRIYQNKTLESKDSIDFSTEKTIETYQIYDHDGYKLGVGYYNVTGSGVQFFEYNGSDWEFLSDHSTYHSTEASFPSSFEEIQFQCSEDTGYCLATSQGRDTGSEMTTKKQYFLEYSFDMDDTSSTLISDNEFDSGNDQKIPCLPQTQKIAITNTGEFVYNYGYFDDINNDFFLRTYVVELNSSGHIFDSTKVVQRDIHHVQDNNDVFCSDNDYIFTAPTVYEGNGFPPQEIVSAYQTDEDSYRIFYSQLDGTDGERYPQLDQGEGTLISNVLIGTFFTHGNEDADFGVMGYNNEDDKLEFLIASDYLVSFFTLGDSWIVESEVNASTFEPSGTQKLIHSIADKTETFNGVDPDEILTPFGIFNFQEDGDLIKYYEIPYTQGISVANDYENVGYADIIYLTGDNLIYIDDDFENTPAEIDEIVINPCVTDEDQSVVWKQNTTVGVTITPIDFQGDQVRARAILYHDYPDSNVTQDSNWSNYKSSGEPFQFSFTADTKTSSATLRLMATDSENPDTEAIRDFSFSVASNGVSFGDCTTRLTDLSEPEDEEAVEEDDITTDENDITRAVNDIEQVLGVPKLLLFVFLLLFVDFALFSALHRIPMVALYTIIIIDFFAFVSASLMGLLPVAFVVSSYALIIILGIGYIMHIVNRSYGD